MVGYPTFVALNPEAVTLGRWIGYDKAMFLKNALAAAEDPTTIDEKLARYESKPTADDAATLAGYRDSRGEYAMAVDLYRDATKMEPASDFIMPIFESTFYAVRREQLPQADLTASADAVFAAAEPKPADMLNVAMMMAYMGRRTEDPSLGVPYIKNAIERTEQATDEEVLEARKDILPDYALLILKDEAKAVTYKKDTFAAGWTEEPDALNSFAWWCFSNEINLAEAQEMAAKGAGLAEPGAEKAQILDTLAEICHARGDSQAAVAQIKLALQEDPESEHYQKQLEKFETAVSGGGSESRK